MRGGEALPAIELRDVGVSFGAFVALREVNLVIGRLDRIAIVGPSGSGKTTLLRVISGALKASGTVCVRGPLGVVYQDPALLPWMTIRSNITLGLPTSKLGDDLANWIDAAGLHDKLDSYPYMISGGQQKRVAILRALAVGPSLLLLDEPYSALDFLSKRKVADLVEKLASARDLATVMVTHDLDDAMRSADRVVVLREGRIVGDVAVIRTEKVDIRAVRARIESLYED